MKTLLAVLASAAAIAAISPAVAQNYPSRSITMVVPFAAGGPTDTIARIMAERMGRALRQTVVVENVTGAAGSIGVGTVKPGSMTGWDSAMTGAPPTTAAVAAPCPNSGSGAADGATCDNALPKASAD